MEDIAGSSNVITLEDIQGSNYKEDEGARLMREEIGNGKMSATFKNVQTDQIGFIRTPDIAYSEDSILQDEDKREQGGLTKTRTRSSAGYLHKPEVEHVNNVLLEQKKQKKKVTFQTRSNKQSKSKTDINKIEPTIHGGDNINTRYRTRVSKKRVKCSCIISTSVSYLQYPTIKIHNRRKIKAKSSTCPLAVKNRVEWSTRIKTAYQKNTGPMIKEMGANKLEDRIIAAYRMQEYIENAAYIIKQTGNKEDMISLIFELENLITATGIVRSQIHRWKEADDLRYDINEYASRLRKAEIQEAILGGEWTLRNNRQEDSEEEADVVVQLDSEEESDQDSSKENKSPIRECCRKGTCKK